MLCLGISLSGVACAVCAMGWCCIGSVGYVGSSGMLCRASRAGLHSYYVNVCCCVQWPGPGVYHWPGGSSRSWVGGGLECSDGPRSHHATEHIRSHAGLCASPTPRRRHGAEGRRGPQHRGSSKTSTAFSRGLVWISIRKASLFLIFGPVDSSSSSSSSN